MGLFSNIKKSCPICGEDTPRLLATQIADRKPICSDCSARISMVSTQVWELSVGGLRDHLIKREENANYLENTFRPNKKISVGWTSINIDEANKVFTLPLNMCGDTKNPPVFKFEELIGYELEEENCVIERFNRGDVAPQFASMGVTPVIHIKYDKDQKPEKISRSFKLILYLSNPCWEKVESSAGNAYGSVHNFQREYSNRLGEIRMVTTALADIIGAGTSGTHDIYLV